MLGIRFASDPRDNGQMFREFERLFGRILITAADEVVERVNILRGRLICATEIEDTEPKGRAFVEAHAAIEVVFHKWVVRMRADTHEGAPLTSEFASDEIAERIGELMRERY